MPTQPSGSDPTAVTPEPTDAAEGASDDGRLRAEALHFENTVGGGRRSRAEAAKAKIGQLADNAAARVDQASAAASELNSRAAAAYDRACASARRVQQRVDPLIHERPYAAIGIAACAGIFLGMLLGRGPKVIYLRSRD